MNLKLIRQEFTKESTIGTLYANDKQVCFVLEDVVRPKGVKVYGKTAIPAGTYHLSYSWSPRFKRKIWTVDNVPNFSGIRIHSGNTAKDTEGCLILGFKKQPNRVFESQKALAAFEQLMKPFETTGATIEIVDNFATDSKS